MHPLLLTRETANHITHLTSKVRARTPTLSKQVSCSSGAT